jgi:hypothetical protein
LTWFGGGPGKPTTIRLEDLQAWCLSEGLAMPVESGERLERLPPSAMMERLERLDELFAGMQRLEHLMEQVLARLDRSQAHAIGPDAPATDSTALPRNRVGLMAHIRQMKDVERKSYQQIAGALNAAGIPTISGRGKWGKGNVERLYKAI